MPKLGMAPPYSPVEPVTEVLHGIAITDPYRWLEEQDSPQTREWLRAQHEYARAYLDAIAGRERIRERIRELLDVETYDSVQKVGNRYFFRKRMPGQEQPCIYFRNGANGTDQLLIDPAERGTGAYTAAKPLHVSPDGRLLLYEIKEGGERTGKFELFDIEARQTLPDALPRGYLRSFAFAPDAKSFFYVHEACTAKRPFYRAAYQHVLGTASENDQEIFYAGESQYLRLLIVPGTEHLGFLIFDFAGSSITDCYLWPIGSANRPDPILLGAKYAFGPMLLPNGQILAITDREAPNFKIVEVHLGPKHDPEFVDVVPETEDQIQSWTIAGAEVFVSYAHNLKTEIKGFDLAGKPLPKLPIDFASTVRLAGNTAEEDEVFLEHESFTQPIRICQYSPRSHEVCIWADRKVPFDSPGFTHTQLCFFSKDGTSVPIYLVGRRDLLHSGSHPTIMTSYGGYGVSMTPQFSVLVAFLIERGCLFALPSIRGGSEFGIAWHEAAKRRKRQVAFDDFISAAEWLIESGRTNADQLAIFGGSNSGLLVAAVMTQRPDLFRAVLCMVPILDMLRYHLFDNAHVWKDEFGTADDPEDFRALLGYSPYHNVHERRAYPASMLVSGDSDQQCNSLHSRKLTARLQAANISDFPIFLDYSPHRGHSPVMPLSMRINALTDRLAFLCNQLQLQY